MKRRGFRLGLPLGLAWMALGISGALAQGAQEESSGAPKPAAARPTPRFFDQPIDFWSRGLRLQAPEPAGSAPGPGPVTAGLGTDHPELPRPLRILLDQPTPQNVRAYFEWRIERARKLIRAAELIKEYRETQEARGDASLEREPAPGVPTDEALPTLTKNLPGPPKASSDTPPPGPSLRILYFHRKDCPHCVTQDEILARWKEDKPEIRILTLEAGTSPETWDTLGIRGTPTLFFQNPASEKSLKLEGLSKPAELDRALLECRRPAPRLPSLHSVPRGPAPLGPSEKGETP